MPVALIASGTLSSCTTVCTLASTLGADTADTRVGAATAITVPFARAAEAKTLYGISLGASQPHSDCLRW